MTKCGKLSDAEQQFCFDHGIHLAVREVLNNSNVSEEKSEYKIFVESVKENEHEDNDDNEDCVIENCSTDTVSHDLNHNCLPPLVMKIRKVIRIVRNSKT